MPLRGVMFFADQVLLSEHFRLRPGCRQKPSLRTSGVGCGGSILILVQLHDRSCQRLIHCVIILVLTSTHAKSSSLDYDSCLAGTQLGSEMASDQKTLLTPYKKTSLEKLDFWAEICAKSPGDSEGPKRGKLFCLWLALFFLQLSIFAHSPFSSSEIHTPAVSKKASTVSKKGRES